MASEGIQRKADQVASVAARADGPAHEGSQLLQGKVPSDDSKSLGHPIHPATVHWPIAVSPCSSPFSSMTRLLLLYPLESSGTPRSSEPYPSFVEPPALVSSTTLIPVLIHHILRYSPNIPSIRLLPLGPPTRSIFDASHSTLHSSSSRRHLNPSNRNRSRRGI